MCGITGWIDWNYDLCQKEATLASMTKTLGNRGPDAAGIWLSHNAAFGHRRLTVVDPEGGAQPMLKEKGGYKYVITYNGELYNTPELRSELLSRGYCFKGHSDTEVLLISYLEWGPECVDRLNGIYAFGIWDEKHQSLFLVKDRVGVKPLFYSQTSSGLVFGSELKALLAHPEIKPEVNKEGLAEVFVVGPARTPGKGIFKNIFELKPGQCLMYNQDGLKLRHYWALTSKPHEDDLPTTIRTVRKLIHDSIERQLVADVPVCTFLSGGIDSSAITGIAARYFHERGLGKLNTYSVDFIDNNIHFKPNKFQPNSDTDWIPLVSDFFETEHHNIYFDTPEQIATLREGVLARDLPGMTDIDTSLYLFCKEIKKSATVALSGECADEIFGGYPWFLDQEALNANTFPWALKTQERAKVLSPELLVHISPEQYMADRYEEALAEVPRLKSDTAEEARMREMFYLNITRFMTTLLDRKDRMSMFTGLEVRVPFCDHRLLEYVWNVPWKMKFHNNIEKGLLREALSDLLPEKLLKRRKSPYPKTHNPSYLASVQKQFLEIISDSSSPLLPLVNVKYLRTLAKNESTDNRFGPTWFGQLMGLPQLFAYLIQVDIWLREYNVSIT